MKLARWIGIALVVYLVIIVAFESLIGVLQPEADRTLVITTTDEDGVSKDRVLARLESADQIYVAANHWPRAWYEQALAHPQVSAAFDGHARDYIAVPVPVESEEHARLQRENETGLGFRFLTGFPPRYFLRLEPRPATGS